MSNARVTMIQDRLNAALHPSKLIVNDNSAAHAGHTGANGGGHFNIEVVSEMFAGKSPVARHRMIYAALGDAMESEIHALSIKALSPEEV